jgi:hypothetical protein
MQNGTTGKPEPGSPVILFTASGEQGRATTDENGAFQIVPSKKLDPLSPAILQVTHDGIEYFQSVRPGQRTNVKVYEVSSQVSGITGYLSVLQFQVKGKLLQVTELHAFNNGSSPPLTRSSPDNFEFSIPEGARVQPATISAPDGGTLKLPLVPIPGQNGNYRIDFPMKPGLTKYAISYEVPYSGELVFRRRAQYPLKQIGIFVPDSMHFRSLGAKAFHAVVDQPGMQEQVLDGLKTNEPFAFELSGSGGLAHSFRPLSPGTPPTKPKLLSPPWPQSGSSETTASPAHARTGLIGRQVILAMGILVLAGLWLWRLISKRNVIV